MSRIHWSSTFVAQGYSEEGAADIVFTNSTSDLLSVKSSPGDLSVSGETITDLKYEFSDSAYKWDEDRDLKAVEPTFTVGTLFTEEAAKLKGGIKKGIA